MPCFFFLAPSADSAPSADPSPSSCRLMLEPPSSLAAGDLNHVKVHQPNSVCISPVKAPNTKMDTSKTSA